MKGETWDTQEVLELVRWMRRYNEDPSQVAPIQTSLAPLTERNAGAFLRLPRERHQEIRQVLDTLSERFEREPYTRQSSPGEWTLARQNLRVLRQYLGHLLREENGGRDRAMAENLLWLLEWNGPGAKAVVWAHNGHVKRGPSEWPTRCS